MEEKIIQTPKELKKLKIAYLETHTNMTDVKAAKGVNAMAVLKYLAVCNREDAREAIKLIQVKLCNLIYVNVEFNENGADANAIKDCISP